MAEDRKFEKTVEEVAIKSATNDGMDKDDYSKAPYNGDFNKYAIEKMAVYQCYECKKPYPAGRKDCGQPSMKKEDCYCSECTVKKLGPIKGISN